MKVEQSKIKQEKLNAKVTTKRIGLTNYVRDKMIDIIIGKVGVLNEDTPYHTKRNTYDLLLNEIVDNCIGLYKFDNENITKRLNEVIKHIPIDTAKLLRTTQEDITPLERQVILDKTIKGLNYSDRIWNNTVQLGIDIQNIVYDHLFVSRLDLGALSKDISKRYDVDLYKATRLLDNETARVEYEVRDLCYMKSPIVEKLQRITMEDDRVSELCRSEHGDIWDKDDPNRPTLPRHVKCRCIYRPYFNNMDKYSFIGDSND